MAVLDASDFSNNSAAKFVFANLQKNCKSRVIVSMDVANHLLLSQRISCCSSSVSSDCESDKLDRPRFFSLMWVLSLWDPFKLSVDVDTRKLSIGNPIIVQVATRLYSANSLSEIVPFLNNLAHEGNVRMILKDNQDHKDDQDDEDAQG